jgi:hypothetical protein
MWNLHNWYKMLNQSKIQWNFKDGTIKSDDSLFSFYGLIIFIKNESRQKGAT